MTHATPPVSRSLRVGLAILATVVGVRALLFLVYAWLELGHPLEAFFLEAKMTWLSARFQAGHSLYPDWQSGPYEPNFFAPLYFMLVGAIGRAFDLDLDALARVGRGVSIASSLLAAAVVSRIWTQQGGSRTAAVVAGLATLGSVPLVHFGTMARPDAMADALGIAGFAAALALLRLPPGTARLSIATLMASVLLSLAMFTKQTAAMYLIASVGALLVRRSFSRAAMLAAATIACSSILLAVLVLSGQRGLPAALLGEAGTPWLARSGLALLTRLLSAGPELPLFTVTGLLLWVRGIPRRPEFVVLTVVVWSISIITALKLGSDYNYFLAPRLAAALGLAAAWDASRSDSLSGKQRAIALVAILVMALSVIPSLISLGQLYLSRSRELARFESRAGRFMLEEHRRIAADCADPAQRILTDDGWLALHQGTRAPFVDPWLFRINVGGQRIRPDDLANAIVRREFDLIVTTTNLFRPGRGSQQFTLPEPLASHVRAAYIPAGRTSLGRFLYRPSPDPEADPGAAPDG